MDSPKAARRPTTRHTARLRRAERKQQVLATAKKLFLTLGYQHTTTEKIAEAAGVTEPVLYRHFPSKKALFLAVLQEIREATLGRWRSAIAGLTDPLEKLHTVFGSYLDTTREQAVELRIMHRTLIEAGDSEIAALLREFYLDSEKFLAQILQEGQVAGVFRTDVDPRVGAWDLIGSAVGFILTAPLAIPLYREDGYAEKAIACLLTGLVVRSG